MDVLFPKLKIALLFGATATAYAASQGYGLLACLLIYSVAGQATLGSLAVLDLVKSDSEIE